MKLTRKQLGRIICEELSSHGTLLEFVDSEGTPEIAGRIRDMARQWKRDDGTQIRQKDPEAEALLRDIWDSAGWEDQGYSQPWSAATISTAASVGPTGWPTGATVVAHNEYQTAGYANRENWFKGLPLNAKSSRGNTFDGWIAFRPEEFDPKEGDIPCAGRDGAAGSSFEKLGTSRLPTHCDVCLDDGCNQVAGGNIRLDGDDDDADTTLGIRNRKSGTVMYITREPEPFADLPIDWKLEFLDELPSDIKASVEAEADGQDPGISESAQLLRNFIRCEIARK